MEVAAFHPPADRCYPEGRRLVSVALFIALVDRASGDLWRLGVTQHPALRSPDFPPLVETSGDGLADFGPRE